MFAVSVSASHGLCDMPGSAKASAKALAASIYTLSVAKDQDVVAGILSPPNLAKALLFFFQKPMQAMSSLVLILPCSCHLPRQTVC